MLKYSVLMSVYHKENPKWFDESLDSMVNQTIEPDQIVLVCDGPLTKDLEKVIHNYESKYNFIDLVRLETNQGLGNALNYGLANCTNNIVFRMDTDDISISSRCEKQLAEFEKNPNLIIVGSNVLEFGDGKETLKLVPETDSEIRKYSIRRSPFNHPSVAFKKSAVESVGGYKSLFLNEDYDLWMRLLNGIKGEAYNVQECLVHMRVNKDLYNRRGGWKYALAENKLQKNFYNCGYISLKDYILNSIIRFPVRLMPNKLRSFLYKNILRRKSENEFEK